MSASTLCIFITTISISAIWHIISYFIKRRPKFVVVGKMRYREFKSWHKAKEFINQQVDEYQVFIYEKHEYTFITSSHYLDSVVNNKEVEI